MIALNAASQIAAMGAALALQTGYSIAIARALGPGDFGSYAFIWSIVQILLLGGDLGLHNSAIREISTRPQASLEISTTFFSFKLILSFALFTLIVLLSLLVSDRPEVQVTLLVFGAGMFFHSLSLAINAVFQAHGKLYWASLNIFTIFLGQFIIGIALLFLGGRLISLGVAYATAVLIALLLNYWICRRKIHSLRVRSLRGRWSFIRNSFPVGLSILFQTIASRVSIALVTFIAGSYTTGIFSAPYRITAALGNIPLGISSAVLPALASYQNKPDKLRPLLGKFLPAVIVIAVPLSVVLYLVAEPVMLLVYGEQYRAGIDNLRILAWSLIPVFLAMVLSQVLLSQHDLIRVLPWVTGTAMAANIGLNLLLIPRMGGEGAAWALLITEVVLVLAYGWVAVRYLGRRMTRVT